MHYNQLCLLCIFCILCHLSEWKLKVQNTPAEIQDYPYFTNNLRSRPDIFFFIPGIDYKKLASMVHSHCDNVYVSALNLIASSRRVSSRNSWLIVWVNTAPGWRPQLVITWCIKLQRCSRWCGTSVPWGLSAKWRLKKTTGIKQINSFRWVTDYLLSFIPVKEQSTNFNERIITH